MIDIAEPFINSQKDNVYIRPIENRDICMDRSLRAACEQNFCGQFGKNCMCPPLVGDIDPLIDKVRNSGDGLLIQTVHTLEDSFDYEGMTNGKTAHTEVFMKLKSYLEERVEKGATLSVTLL